MGTTRSRAKRRDGAGSYWYSEAEGRWRARFTDSSGRLRNLSAGTEEDIVRRLEQEIAKRAAGTLALTPNQTPTLGVWLEQWLASRSDLAPKTRERHAMDLRLYVIPHLGLVRLDKLSALQIEHLYALLGSQPSARRAQGLSPSSVRRVHAVLATALTDAHRLGVMAAPVMHRVRAPRTAPQRLWDILTVGEVERLLAAASHIGLSSQARWAIAAKWGLRQGEVLGLRWSDIDLATGRIDVRRQIQRQTGNGLVTKPPKANSFRHLMIDAATLADLRALYNQVGGHDVGTTADDDRYLFCGSRGGAVDPANDQHRFKALLAKAGIRDVGVHALRHTALTRMVEQGVPLPVVKEIAGHADIRTTMRYLQLANSPAKINAALLVQQAYGVAATVTTLPWPQNSHNDLAS